MDLSCTLGYMPELKIDAGKVDMLARLAKHVRGIGNTNCTLVNLYSISPSLWD
jgi:hypothetical protein